MCVGLPGRRSIGPGLIFFVLFASRQKEHQLNTALHSDCDFSSEVTTSPLTEAISAIPTIIIQISIDCDRGQCRCMSLQLPLKVIDSNLMKRIAIYSAPRKNINLFHNI